MAGIVFNSKDIKKLENKTENFIKEIDKLINSKPKDFIKLLEKEVSKSFGVTTNQKDFMKLKKMFTNERMLFTNEIENEVYDIVRNYAKNFTDNAEKLDDVTRSTSQEIIGEYATQMMGVEQSALNTLTNIIEINHQFDQKILRKAIEQSGDLKQSLIDFNTVFKGDYSQDLYQKMLKDPNVEKFVKDGRDFFRFKNSGREYEVESYIDNYTNYITDSVSRDAVDYADTKLVILERIRAVKVPRDSHEGREGQVYSLDENNTDYPYIGELAELDENDRIEYNGSTFDYPYGCGHTLLPYKE